MDYDELVVLQVDPMLGRVKLGVSCSSSHYDHALEHAMKTSGEALQLQIVERDSCLLYPLETPSG